MSHPRSAHSEALTRWLKRLTGRSPLNEEECNAILDLPGEMHSFGPNRDFVRLGETTSHSCIVASGLAGRFDQTASGARQIVALHIPGDAADLHSAPLPKASSALQALTHSEILKVPHEALRVLLDRYPSLALAFWRDCVVDTAILAKWTLNIGRASARQRVAHLLCELASRYVAIGESPTNFPLPATQTQIGDATGMTNVHVNRTLRGLSDAGLATVRSGRVEIRNWRALVQEADFDPAYLHLGNPETGAGAHHVHVPGRAAFR